MVLDSREDGTARFVGVGAVAVPAVLANLEYLAEIVTNLGTLDVEGAEALYARSVDDAAARGEVEELAEGGGVLTGVVCCAYLGDLDLRFGDKAVEQGRLADSAVATEQCHLVLEQCGESVESLAGSGRTLHAVVAQSIIEVCNVVEIATLILVEQIDLVEEDADGYAVCFGAGKKAVDECGGRLGMSHGDDEQCQVEVGRNDVALLGEVGSLAYDVVLALLDALDETGGAVGLQTDVDDVANSNWVGASYALQSEIALYLTIKKLATIRADSVPTSCVTYDNTRHQTVIISFSFAA